MRCLHCGKELALLKRLRGGDFCSDAHKQSYREEYNRIGLSRLLQAQNRSTKPKAVSAPPAAAEPVVSVAVEEEIEQTELEPQHAPSGFEEPEQILDQTVEESVEEIEESVEEIEETDDLQEIEVDEDAPAEAEFVSDKPNPSSLPEIAPYVEPWLELAPSPAIPEWSFDSEHLALDPAERVAFPLKLTVSNMKHPVTEVNVTPEQFVNTSSTPSLQFTNSGAHQLASAGPIALETLPRSMDSKPESRLEVAVLFQNEVEFRGSFLLEMTPAGIAFPPEDADVLIGDAAETSETSQEIAAETAAIEEDATGGSPREALEALSRLHGSLTEEMAVEKANATEVIAEPFEPFADQDSHAAEEPAAVEEAAIEEVEAVPETVIEDAVIEEPVIEVAAAEAEEVAAEQENVEIVAEQEAETVEASPREAVDLLEISIKGIPPSKPSPIESKALRSAHPALLPRLSGFPLRSKVALAPRDYVPTAKATPAAPAPPAQATPPKGPSVEVKNKPTASAPGPRPEVVVKPAALKPAQTTPPPPASQGPKPVAPVKPIKPATPAPKPAVAVLKPAVVVKPAPVAVSKPAPPTHPSTPAAPVLKSGPPASLKESTPHSGRKPTAPAAPEKPAVPVEAPAAKVELKVEPKPEPKAEPKPEPKFEPKPEVREQARLRFSQSDAIIDGPSFGAVGTRLSFLGSLKGKLSIAIMLVIAGIGAYVGLGSKSSGPSTSAAASKDGPGPSIMVGEGGWVEGWAGDPAGAHYGRQITIYRPSLKLTDYRVEFQGQIENKSIGWVFRAADPENYYAMKLSVVSAGLSPKVALFKYLIANGRQTQVGRVPIETDARHETVFKVRVDVRGPRFSTYVQDQPVDVWTDDQLKSGGVGFLNERDERGKVKSVSISLLNGGGK